MLTLNDGRSELWQWDTGRKLTVDADCSQVHFSNKVFGRSIDVDVVDGVSIIPDILLQTDKDLNVWAFVGTPENGYTKISKVFKVNKRNKPADYVFTPPEQTTLEEIKEKLDYLESIQDPDAIKNAVDEYLANNPIQIDEKDPTVPDWAKQTTKPKYTATEVGAVAKVNGVKPDANGNVEITIPDSGGNVDLTGYATEQYVKDYAQPKGEYLTAVPEGYAKTEDIPTKPEDIGAQPSGNYLTEVPSGYATEEFVKNKIAEAELGGEEVDLSGYAQKSELPTKVSQLQNDAGYLTEHQDISGKLDASELPTAINTALAQAKASGEFDGKDGADGMPGEKGDKGDPGEPGQKGDKGDPGEKGEQGIQGVPGEKGEKGDTGAPGADGAKGDKGDKGEQGEPGKDGSDGKDGKDGSAGADGVSPTVSVSKSGKVTTVSITDKNGTKTATINDGADGSPGSNGKDGTSVTVSKVNESATDGGSNVITFSDGKTLTVKNGKTGAAGKDGSDGLPGVDGAPGQDGHTPVRGIDYYTEADKAEFSTYIATELAKRGQLKPEFAQTIEDCTDTTKLYVLPDGYVYAYILTEKEVDNGPSCTNWLPKSINADGSDYVGDNGEDGYRPGYRYSSSSNSEKAASGYDCVGYIPAKAGDIIRIANATQITSANDGSSYCVAYFFTIGFERASGSVPMSTSAYENGITSFTIPSYSNIAYFKITLKGVSANTIITVNEEITEGGGTEIVKEYAWTSTGHAFVPADYEDRIIALEKKVGIAGGNQINLIRNWDAPIYDDAPVFLCSENKPAMGTTSVAAVYARYDALMAAHRNYITKTDLGLASDGTTHIYRYDFCEPRARKNPENNNHPELVKPKAIIVSGVHAEYAGIYALYYALEEIANNKELYQDLRKNTHLIVVPCMNPYCLSGNSDSNGRKNANGVEIHRNFEVDHIVIDSSSNNYGGATPLSEVESQYVDAIMAENTDAAFFLTCHNFDYDTYFGTSFIWPSVATRYMYNMGSRLIDKMSKAWLDKYGDAFKTGVDAVKTSSVSDGDYTVGLVGMSGSPGTEAKQALKYGIQGTNVEVAKMFKVFNSTVGSTEVMTHGAEVYVNFLRMAFGCYDHKDKNLYQI